MEDLVAVAVRLEDGREAYFITWGRLHDRVDARPLSYVVLKNAEHFAIDGKPVGARLCCHLTEAKEAPLFFEALFDFSQKRIPNKKYKKKYKKWRREVLEMMWDGRFHLYFVGTLPSSESPHDLDVQIGDGYAIKKPGSTY